MKKTLLVLLSVFVLSVTGVFGQPQEDSPDSTAINQQVQKLVTALNSSDGVTIKDLLAKNASEKARKVIEDIQGSEIDYKIGKINLIWQDDDSVLAKWQVNSRARGTANMSIQGLSHKATFIKEDGQWKIIDGDFNPTTFGEFGKFFFIIPLIVVPLVIIFFGFWIWMLVHAATHDINNKTIWVIVICLAQWIGALIYFFTERKRFTKGENMDKNKNNKTIYIILGIFLALILLVVGLAGWTFFQLVQNIN